MNTHEELIPTPTNESISIGNEAFSYIMNEFEGGEWAPRFNALSEGEKKALFLQMIDAFEDEI